MNTTYKYRHTAILVSTSDGDDDLLGDGRLRYVELTGHEMLKKVDFLKNLFHKLVVFLHKIVVFKLTRN